MMAYHPEPRIATTPQPGGGMVVTLEVNGLLGGRTLLASRTLGPDATREEGDAALAELNAELVKYLEAWE